MRASQLGFKVKETEHARREALLSVVDPIAQNLRLELGNDATHKSISELIRGRLNAALALAYPNRGDRMLDRLEWAGAYDGMLSAVKGEAAKVILTLTAGTRVRGQDGGYQSPMLRTMLLALRKDEKLPLRAKRFDYLHADLLEVAANSLVDMRPELQMKMEACVTALHIKAVTDSTGEFDFENSGYYSRRIDNLRSTFTTRILERLSKSMTHDVMAATNRVLASVFESKELITATLLSSKTGLARLMQEDAASAAERRKLGAAMAGLRAAMVSIASATGKQLDPVEDAATADEGSVEAAAAAVIQVE